MLLPVGFFPKTSSKFPLSSPPFQYDSVTSLSCKLHSRLFYSTLDEKLPRPVRSWLEPIPKVKVGKENLVLDSFQPIRYHELKVAKSSGQELKSRKALEAYAVFFCRPDQVCRILPKNKKRGESNAQRPSQMV
jgi:hypothetical protein